MKNNSKNNIDKIKIDFKNEFYSPNFVFHLFRAGLEKGRPAESNFKCELFLSSDGVSTLNNSIFLGCTLQFVEPWYLLWEQAWCLILMSLALLALVVSSSLIVVKLLASKRIQNNSIKRMEE